MIRGMAQCQCLYGAAVPSRLFQHLNSLIDNYLEPLRRESFISPVEISALFGNIPDIVEFQRDFVQSLEEAVEMEPNLTRLETPTQFKVRSRT